MKMMLHSPAHARRSPPAPHRRHPRGSPFQPTACSQQPCVDRRFPASQAPGSLHEVRINTPHVPRTALHTVLHAQGCSEWSACCALGAKAVVRLVGDAPEDQLCGGAALLAEAGLALARRPVIVVIVLQVGCLGVHRVPRADPHLNGQPRQRLQRGHKSRVRPLPCVALRVVLPVKAPTQTDLSLTS